MPVNPTALAFDMDANRSCCLAHFHPKNRSHGTQILAGKASPLLRPPTTCLDRVLAVSARKQERRRLDLALGSFLYRALSSTCGRSRDYPTEKPLLDADGQAFSFKISVSIYYSTHYDVRRDCGVCLATILNRSRGHGARRFRAGRRTAHPRDCRTGSCGIFFNCPVLDHFRF
jgi:hypothetical protein